MEISVEVAYFAVERLLCIGACVEQFALLEERLGLLLVLPEIWVADFFFECGYFFAGGGSVKDSSA
jgi:hypothetical protein